MAQHYVVNAPRVIHETLDGEVVAIDLGTGAYYSMRGTAAVVWDSLVAGLDADAVVAHVASTHDTDGADVARDVATMVADLRARELLVPGTPATGGTPPAGENLPYAAPVVEEYTDMADVILLDPVHDVDASAGWPHLPDTDTAGGPTDG